MKKEITICDVCTEITQYHYQCKKCKRDVCRKCFKNIQNTSEWFCHSCIEFYNNKLRRLIPNLLRKMFQEETNF